MNKPLGPTIFGEVLFDCFPSGEKSLGGAPFNVAWHLQAFGDSPGLITRVGNDDQGDEIIQFMQNWGMHTGYIQQDDIHPTGRVEVTLIDNEPHYDIIENSAYDFIELPDNGHLNSSNILYHGTLALRNSVSQNTLISLVNTKKPSIFLDVNLRQPWWRKENVLTYMQNARWVKLNQDELNLLSDSNDNLLGKMKKIIEQCKLELLIVTLGEEGAVILDNNENHFQKKPPKPREFVDTVGAGDAFTALFIHGLIQGNPIDERLDKALQFATRVVELRGATTNDQAFYQDVVQELL